MPYEKPTAVDIDRKLRDDFRRRLRDFGISAEATDPILAVLFRTLGGQLEELYSASDRIRLALLDELISGLGIEARRARAAQTVVRFLTGGSAELVEAGTELIGEADTGDRLTFTTDVTINVSPARLAMVATYQNGELRLLPGFEMPDEIQSARPSLEPVRANLGAHPAIYLAIENLPEHHLSRHGVFIELGPDSSAVQRALHTEPWCLAANEGDLGATGILRPERTNAGIRELKWLVPERAKQADNSGKSEIEVADLPDGFYAGRVFVFPTIPASRRFLCGVPKAMQSAFQRVFGPETDKVLGQERAWVRISLPQNVPELHTAITNISLHAVTASNAECFNETINFETHGHSVPISREAGTSKYLVAPLSVFGETGGAYLPPFEPSAATPFTTGASNSIRPSRTALTRTPTRTYACGSQPEPSAIASAPARSRHSSRRAKRAACASSIPPRPLEAPTAKTWSRRNDDSPPPSCHVTASSHAPTWKPSSSPSTAGSRTSPSPSASTALTRGCSAFRKCAAASIAKSSSIPMRRSRSSRRNCETIWNSGFSTTSPCR